MKKNLIIAAERAGYSTDQIGRTMTVGELIEELSQYDEDTKVYIGNDKWSNGSYYTYGGITWESFEELEEEDEDEDEDEE